MNVSTVKRKKKKKPSRKLSKEKPFLLRITFIQYILYNRDCSTYCTLTISILVNEQKQIRTLGKWQMWQKILDCLCSATKITENSLTYRLRECPWPNKKWYAFSWFYRPSVKMQRYLINRNSTKMKRLLRLTNFNLPSYFGLKSAKIIELFSQNA